MFEVILEEHEMIEQKMHQAVNEMKQDGDIAEQQARVVWDFLILASKSPILKMINTREVEILARKLPPEVLKEHLEHDSSAVKKFFPYYLLRREPTRTLSVPLSVRFILPYCMRRKSGKNIFKMSFIT